MVDEKPVLREMPAENPGFVMGWRKFYGEWPWNQEETKYGL